MATTTRARGRSVAGERPPRAAVEPPPPGHVRVRLLVAYDGTGFSGFAENRGVRTVGGELRAAIERVLGAPVELAVAGRTDAGVHARGQVVSFDAPADGLDTERLARSLNALVGPEVAVRSAELAPGDFHARHSATWRAYAYRILQSPTPDPFLATRSWWIDDVLDLEAMSEAAAVIVGRHDFSSFCRRPKDREVSLERTVTEAFWEVEAHPDGRLVTFRIRAAAFCHQMVRALTGTLVEVGRGRRDPGSVRAALVGADRSLAGQLAPPRGLTLEAVGYGAAGEDFAQDPEILNP